MWCAKSSLLGSLTLLFFVSITSADQIIEPARAKLIGAPQDAKVTLVYLHGVFHGSWSFSVLQPKLDRPGRAHALVDLRGHGNGSSLNADSPVGFGEYLSDTHRMLDGIPGPKVLIGHSLGGLLALSVAARADVSGLALLAVPLPEVLSSERWNAVIRYPILSVRMLWSRDPSVWYHDEGWARRYLIGQDASESEFGWAIGKIRQQREPYQLFEDLESLELEIQSIEKPALVLFGTSDPTVDEKAASILAGRLDTEAVAIPGAPHGLMLTENNSDQVAERINEWLLKVPLQSNAIPSQASNPLKDSSDWLSGSPIKTIPRCRDPFYRHLLGLAGLSANAQSDEWTQLARDRIANLTNRIIFGWKNLGMRRFEGELTYLVLANNDGQPGHFSFDLARDDVEPWIRKEERCEAQF